VTSPGIAAGHARRGGGKAKVEAREAHDSAPLRIAARVGLASRGVVYILVGVLAIGIAVGTTNAEADRSGALRQIADKPFGTALLAVMTAGFVGYAVWRLVDGLVGHADESDDKKRAAARANSLVRAAIYASITATTISFLVHGSSGGGSGSGSGSNPAPWTARMMKHTGGRELVGLVGVVVIGIGVAFVVKMFTASFMKKLRTGEMSPSVRSAVSAFGRVGYAARGVVFGLVGVFLLKAAVQFDPKDAKGIDGTLKTLAGQAYGQWLLGVCAVGLVMFGLFSFLQARYRKF
jgi:hypothetical protein